MELVSVGLKGGEWNFGAVRTESAAGRIGFDPAGKATITPAEGTARDCSILPMYGWAVCFGDLQQDCEEGISFDPH